MISVKYCQSGLKVSVAQKKTKQLRASAFEATREHHSTETAEDYCELVLELITKYGQARTCQIAEELGISHVTAIRTINRLQIAGYLQTSPRKPVSLTPKGKRLGIFAQERHQLLFDFLVKIGAPADVAKIDAEGAEHHFSDETLSAIRRFMKIN
ncbi:MAG: iron dependent repressor, metal binding and dimerization domain protein [bacterium]|nr:iron dependent repressor, metal binding and dimerization domain protein [bacterium]